MADIKPKIRYSCSVTSKALPLVLAMIMPACLFSVSVSARELKPFESDGCSAFPDGTFAQNELWLSCCTAHDYAYWKGGTYKEREEADLLLEACVADVGEPEIARLMLAGVRVGGSPIWPTQFRWGYGWPYPRLYSPLTEEEQMQIMAMEREVNP